MNVWRLQEKNTKVMFTAYENVDFDAWSNDVLLWQSVSEGEENYQSACRIRTILCNRNRQYHESVVYFYIVTVQITH